MQVKPSLLSLVVMIKTLLQEVVARRRQKMLLMTSCLEVEFM